MKKTKNKTAHVESDLVKLGMLSVVISGSYAVYVICIGTEGITPKVMVAPLAVWIAIQLIHKFTK